MTNKQDKMYRDTFELDEAGQDSFHSLFKELSDGRGDQQFVFFDGEDEDYCTIISAPSLEEATACYLDQINGIEREDTSYIKIEDPKVH